MKQRTVDKDGNIAFGGGLGNYVTKNDATMLNVITRLKSISGDCFFNLTAHIDWDNLLGSKNFSKARLDSDVKKVVLETEDVTSIFSFESFLKDRIYYATIVFVTEDNSALTLEFNTEGIM